jgi:hypothetical protein
MNSSTLRETNVNERKSCCSMLLSSEIEKTGFNFNPMEVAISSLATSYQKITLLKDMLKVHVHKSI